jgi:superfamily II DNA or RNA helicase
MPPAIRSDRFALRPYQEEARRAIHAGFREFDRQLLVLPTGGGKTRVFSQLAADFQPKRTLILAHREELISQAVEKLHSSTGIAADVERAGCRASLTAPVVVASVQTLMREPRRARWRRDHFGLVVVDECHHLASDSYQAVLGHFHGHAQVLGVTATPDRGDKQNLGRYFQNIAYEATMLGLTKDGWLAPIRVQTVPLGISLNGVRSVAGDFQAEDLGHALDPYLERIAEILLDYRDRKILVFLPLIWVSERFADLCRQRGIAAEHVDGQSRDRKEILARFSRGETRLLANAMLLTEGYDEPSIDCVVCLRPTKVRSLYSQILGRGTRIHPGKDHLLVLDFLWQYQDHRLIRPAHLVARDEDEAAAISEVLGADGFLGAAQDQVEEERRRELAQKAAEADRTARLRERLQANRHRAARILDPLELAVSLNESRLAHYVPVAPWQAQPVSEKQRQALARFGINLRSVTCKGHASLLLDRLFERRQLKLATPRQVRALHQLGHAHPETASFEEASDFLADHLGSAA